MLYVRDADVPLVLALALRAFPPGDATAAPTFVSKSEVAEAAAAVDIPEEFGWVNASPCVGVQHVYHTSVRSFGGAFFPAQGT